MGYSYKSYSDTKEVFKKFVNAAEGQAVYGISRSHIMEMAKKAICHTFLKQKYGKESRGCL